jgi:hypothetical protein
MTYLNINKYGSFMIVIDYREWLPTVATQQVWQGVTGTNSRLGGN